jgi:aspartyl-tRNA(Asn)/glutamyl-tRNA(Gln) amidotransferase subunit A
MLKGRLVPAVRLRGADAKRGIPRRLCGICRRKASSFSARRTPWSLRWAAGEPIDIWGHRGNPWDLDRARTPAGSSSGSGVAVAAGLVPWAVGTDTGGSVRLPASWCGLTGLKATFGRVSCYGILPLSQTLDTPGPMARSVEDAALLFCAMQGHDPLDPHAKGLAASNPWAQMDRGVRGMRIGLMPLEERAVASDEVLAAYDRSVKLLKDLGSETAPLAMPLGNVDLGQIAGDFMAIEGYANVADLIDDDNLPLDPDVRPRLLAGRGRSAHEYLELLAKKDELAKQAAALFAGFDALVTPTTTTAALPLEKADQTKGPGHFTRFINVLGLCALALPNGASAEGLPLSLQVICKNGDEATACKLGAPCRKRPIGMNAARLSAGRRNHDEFSQRTAAFAFSLGEEI